MGPYNNLGSESVQNASGSETIPCAYSHSNCLGLRILLIYMTTTVS